MTTKAPPPKQTPYQALAIWLAEQNPQIFNALFTAAQKEKAAKATTGAVSGLGSFWSSLSSGFSSIASDIGSVASSAVNDVSSYLQSKSGTQAMSALAQQYMQNQSTALQGQAIQLQMQRAASGMAPAAIGYTSTGAPVYSGTTLTPAMAAQVQAGNMVPATTTTGTQGYVLNTSGLSSLLPSGSSTLWIVGGVVVIGGAVLLMSGKKRAA